MVELNRREFLGTTLPLILTPSIFGLKKPAKKSEIQDERSFLIKLMEETIINKYTELGEWKLAMVSYDSENRNTNDCIIVQTMSYDFIPRKGKFDYLNNVRLETKIVGPDEREHFTLEKMPHELLDEKPDATKEKYDMIASGFYKKSKEVNFSFYVPLNAGKIFQGFIEKVSLEESMDKIAYTWGGEIANCSVIDSNYKVVYH